MGFPYGNGLYGKGLYSRRPDWWRTATCVTEAWAAQACATPAWTPQAASGGSGWAAAPNPSPGGPGGGFKPGVP